MTNSIFKSLPSFQKKLQEEIKRRQFWTLFRSCGARKYQWETLSSTFPSPYTLLSLHWLCEVPKVSLRKGQIYVAKTSPPEVHEAYLAQFDRLHIISSHV